MNALTRTTMTGRSVEPVSKLFIYINIDNLICIFPTGKVDHHAIVSICTIRNNICILRIRGFCIDLSRPLTNIINDSLNVGIYIISLNNVERSVISNEIIINFKIAILSRILEHMIPIFPRVSETTNCLTCCFNVVYPSSLSLTKVKLTRRYLPKQELRSKIRRQEVNIIRISSAEVSYCKRRFHMIILEKRIRNNTIVRCTSQNRRIVHRTGRILLIRNCCIYFAPFRNYRQHRNDHNNSHRDRNKVLPEPLVAKPSLLFSHSFSLSPS